MPIGRVTGHRGVSGELTVRVWDGTAQPWTTASDLWFEGADGTETRRYAVEGSRAYGDRLVLKLRGIDDANVAAGLRGCRVKIDEQLAPELPDGRHYSASLVGMEVHDVTERRLGEVRDVMPTGGTDLLVVMTEAPDQDDLLIPMAREIVIEIDMERRRIRVRLPEGLEGLN